MEDRDEWGTLLIELVESTSLNNLCDRFHDNNLRETPRLMKSHISIDVVQRDGLDDSHRVKSLLLEA